MKNIVIVQIEGGIGKHIALTSLLPYFEKEYEKIIVVSAYPEIFDNFPSVYRSLHYEVPYAYEEYFKNADDIVFPCGYRDSNFRRRKCHLIEAACRSINIPYQPDIMIPHLYFSKNELDYAKQIKKDLGHFIIIQAVGGNNPFNPPQPSQNMYKDWNLESAEKFVEAFHAIYPSIQVVNYSLSTESSIKGTIRLNVPSKIQFAILSYAETFVAIDSSLQHAGAALAKKGVVLWGATNPNCFGWSIHTNLEGECALNDLHCTRPYFVPSSDFLARGIWSCPKRSCMNIPIENILKAVNEILKPDSHYSERPTIDLIPLIATATLSANKIQQSQGCPHQ